MAAADLARLEFYRVTTTSLPRRNSRAPAGGGNIVSALRQGTERRFPLGSQCARNHSPYISHTSLQLPVPKEQWGSCPSYQEGFKGNLQVSSCQCFQQTMSHRLRGVEVLIDRKHNRSVIEAVQAAVLENLLVAEAVPRLHPYRQAQDHAEEGRNRAISECFLPTAWAACHLQE